MCTKLLLPCRQQQQQWRWRCVLISLLLTVIFHQITLCATESKGQWRPGMLSSFCVLQW